ncbi:MAG: carbohydrate ABC transporter permease [Anaerolineae bacterium]
MKTVAAQKPRVYRWILGERYEGYFFILPALLMLAAVLGFPALTSFIYSITDPKGGGYSFINYRQLFRDSLFWATMKNHFVFVSCTVSLHLLLGMSAALALNTRVKLTSLFRIITILPWTVPDVIAGIIWRWMYDPIYGALNDLLLRFHVIDHPVAWLATPSLVLPSLIFTDVWRGFPFVMLILLAGLQAIPQEHYEAAALDGANWLQNFIYITLPGLRKILVVALALDTIWESRRFGLVQAMTQGGPGHMTEILPTLIYKEYFKFFRFEYASAIAVVMSLLLLLISLPYIRIITSTE